MPKYIDNMVLSVTDDLISRRNRAIRSIMNIVEVSELNDISKKKIREVVLDEINAYHLNTIKILTLVQENKDE